MVHTVSRVPLLEGREPEGSMDVRADVCLHDPALACARHAAQVPDLHIVAPCCGTQAGILWVQRSTPQLQQLACLGLPCSAHSLCRRGRGQTCHLGWPSCPHACGGYSSPSIMTRSCFDKEQDGILWLQPHLVADVPFVNQPFLHCQCTVVLLWVPQHTAHM
jgi:hypothetical protein